MPSNFDQDALAYHRLPVPGKLAIAATKPLATQQDLALAYIDDDSFDAPGPDWVTKPILRAAVEFVLPPVATLVVGAAKGRLSL